MDHRACQCVCVCVCVCVCEQDAMYKRHCSAHRLYQENAVRERGQGCQGYR